MWNISLWKEQTLKQRVWDMDMFELYLKIYKDINLKDILDMRRNRDIVLVNKELLVSSRADSDKI